MLQDAPHESCDCGSSLAAHRVELRIIPAEVRSIPAETPIIPADWTTRVIAEDSWPSLADAAIAPTRKTKMPRGIRNS